LGAHGEGVKLPAEFSPTFRDVVARCLSVGPKDRPSVTELLAWAGGPSTASVPAAPIEPVAAGRLEPAPPRTPVLSTDTAREAPRPVSPMAQSSKPRVSRAAVLAAVVILAAAWFGISLLRSHSTPSPPENGSLLQTPSAAPAAGDARAPVSAETPTTPGRSDVAASSSALHDVIPEISQSAHRTIRGHIKVAVRVIVDQDGSVSSATLDRSGSSRYFRRLALEAAKKWTFPRIDTPTRRVMQVRFDFSRDGTTGQAVTLE
jgi:TonB family protein